MKVHYGFDNLPQFQRTSVAVGSFDGVHRGHRLLIGRLNEIAHRGDLAPDGESIVVTFDPHPQLVLKGKNKLLSTLVEKLVLLGETGVDHVVVVPFTREFSQIDSESFTRDYLQGLLRAHVVLTGEEHHFGHNRSGSAELLKDNGIHTGNLGRYENISSTSIRAVIEAGRMEDAANMLGGGYLIHTSSPHDITKLLPPPTEYTVTLHSDNNQPYRTIRLRIDDSIFGNPNLPEWVRIVGK